MKIVFNSSPLIFLARLNFLEIFVNSSNEFYLPEVVNDEIKAKQDEAKEYIQRLIDDNRIEVRATHLTSLASSLNSRLGKGEAEAIALGTQLQADYFIPVGDRSLSSYTGAIAKRVKLDRRSLSPISHSFLSPVAASHE